MPTTIATASRRRRSARGASADVLTRPFAILTAFNPRSMLLPRKVNDARHSVLRDMLILGCYRVESCVGYEEDPEGTWREPSWLVHGMDRDEAIAFGRVFRQNTIVMCRSGRPELIVTDPTCDDVGKAFLVLQAAAVFVFAELQWFGLRRSDVAAKPIAA